MLERGASAVSDEDLRSGLPRELHMSRDEVGVQVRLDDPADGDARFLRRVEVELHIALRIDDRRLAAVGEQIRSVREAPEIERLEEHPKLRF